MGARLAAKQSSPSSTVRQAKAAVAAECESTAAIDAAVPLPQRR
jgi:hypothetical protein